MENVKSKEEQYEGPPNYWPELEEFAKELGFKVSYDVIFLPLGKTDDYEYGMSIDASHIRCKEPLTERDKEVIRPYILKDKEETLWQPSTPLDCYMPEYIIKIAKLGDKRYIIEKRPKDVTVHSSRALMLAFKFKELGTLDASFLRDSYGWIIKHLPASVAQKLVESKFSELEEKLNEVDAFSSDFPENLIEKIKGNIHREANAYYYSASFSKDLIVPFYKKYPKLFNQQHMYIPW